MFEIRFFMSNDETGELHTVKLENIKDVDRFINTMEDTVDIFEVKGVRE